MRHRIIIAGILLTAAGAWAALQLKQGDGAPGSLLPGEFYTATNTMAVYVGDTASNAVLVGSVTWSNAVEVSGITTNIGYLDASTNAATLYITNGIIRAVTSP